MSKLITILLIISLILPGFSFAQKIKAPETLEEVRGGLEKVWEIIKRDLPRILGKIWREEVLPVWQKIWEWFKVNVWLKIESLFKKEMEKRKPIIEEELKKEKEKLKEEAPKVTKSLWEKLKEIIKK